MKKPKNTEFKGGLVNSEVLEELQQSFDTNGEHLIEAIVRPTLEVVLAASPAKMRRKYNEKFGLVLIDLDA